MKYLIIFLFFLGFSQITAQEPLFIEGDAKILGRIELESTGMGNTFVGAGAGFSITAGEQNSFFGSGAGYLNTSGDANTYYGYQAGRNNRTGGENIAVGRFAMSNSQLLSKNVAIGSRALLQMVDGYGYDPIAGNQDLGTTYNLAIGTSAGQFTNDPTRVGAERNTFVGNNAGLLNTTGFRNAFFGFQAGDTNTEGNWNTCIGHEADVSANNLVNAGSFGNGAVVNASNKIRIGNGNVTTVEGTGWSLPSDGRFKTNVRNNVPGLDFIMGLRPVTYQFDVMAFNIHIDPERFTNFDTLDAKNQAMLTDARQATGQIHTGFIAQEVEETAKKLNFNFNGVVKPKNSRDNYGVSYALFVVPLVKSIQEQQEQISDLKEQNLRLEASKEELEERLSRLESLVTKLSGSDPEFDLKQIPVALVEEPTG
ncbi:MAG: tail fiber domain-containing protein [Saprospiraceae bacterium]|nr:tail fiber domain-containing protein [Saprospiraceae bacterium]